MVDNTISGTYTNSDIGSIQQQIKGLTENLSTGTKAIPDMRTNLANEAIKTEGTLGPLQSQKGDLVKQLFEHDLNFSKQFGDTSSPNFIENPMARQAGKEAMSAPIWGAITTLGSDITSRRAILGDAINRAIEAKKADLDAQKTELENLWQILGFKTEGRQVVEAGGRKLLIDKDGNTIKDLGASELTGQKKEDARLEELKSDARNGMEFSEIMKKYGGFIDAQNILETYNANSKYGKLKATTEDINAKYGTKLTPTTAEQKSQLLSDQKQEKLDKANQIINNIETESQGLAYGPNPMNTIVKSPAGSLINANAKNYENSRLALAKQLASQVFGAEKNTSDKETQAYLALIPGIDDSEESRTNKIQRLKSRINSDLGGKNNSNVNDYRIKYGY